jgi:hypothetical protein
LIAALARIPVPLAQSALSKKRNKNKEGVDESQRLFCVSPLSVSRETIKNIQL